MTHGKGTVPMQFKVSTSTFNIQLKDIKHAPEAPNNLISVGHLTDLRHSALFTPSIVEFRSKSGLLFGMGQKVGRMYWIICRGTVLDIGSPINLQQSQSHTASSLLHFPCLKSVPFPSHLQHLSICPCSPCFTLCPCIHVSLISVPMSP